MLKCGCIEQNARHYYKQGVKRAAFSTNLITRGKTWRDSTFVLLDALESVVERFLSSQLQKKELSYAAQLPLPHVHTHVIVISVLADVIKN